MFEAHQNVQVRGTAVDNNWAICTQIDGVDMSEPYCPFLGQVPTTHYGAGSFTQSQTGLALGTHTLQTFIYTEYGADLGIYEITYRSYKS